MTATTIEGRPRAARALAPRRGRWIGRSILGVGAFHTAFGLWWFARPLGRMAGDGLWSSVGWTTESGRAVAFWFLVAGALALLLGALADWIERVDGRRLPRFFGWALLALTAIGCLCLPVSAFWALLVPAVGAIVGAGPEGAADSGG
jgi:MFS family permease